MGEHLVANNKRAYSGHQTPPITPDGIPSGAPALREALSDPKFRSLSDLRGPQTKYSLDLCELRGLRDGPRRGRGHV